MNDPNWTQVLSALLTPTIAIFGSFIAYKQWRSAQKKLKMELFEKRYSVYSETKSFIISIMSSGKAEDDKLFKFRAATKEAKWVLNDEIAKYLDEKIWNKAIDLQTLRAELEGVPVSDERTANVRKQGEIKKELYAQNEIIEKMFTPFLKLGH